MSRNAYVKTLILKMVILMYFCCEFKIIIMILAILYIISSLIVASLGIKREIGLLRALLWSLLLSPLIGLIIVLISSKQSDLLITLKIKYDSGVISEEEYNKKVRKITPNKEDKINIIVGYLATAIVIVIIYFLIKIL